LDQIDQIIGFTIALGSISPHYGNGTNEAVIKSLQEEMKAGRKSRKTTDFEANPGENQPSHRNGNSSIVVCIRCRQYVYGYSSIVA
jgi:hypothetical protein